MCKNGQWFEEYDSTQILVSLAEHLWQTLNIAHGMLMAYSPRTFLIPGLKEHTLPEKVWIDVDLLVNSSPTQYSISAPTVST